MGESSVRNRPAISGGDDVRLRDAIAHYSRGDMAGAVRIVEQASKRAGQSATLCRGFALILLAAGKFEAACVWFDRLLAHAPSDPAALSGKGMALLGASQPRKAIKYFDRALAIHPIEPEVHYNRGVALRELGEFEAALNAFATASEQRSAYVTALKARCSLLERLGRYEEGLGWSQKLLDASPGDAQAHFQHANLLRELRCYAEAIDAYSKTLTLDPDHRQALYNRGIAFQDAGRSELSVADIEAFLALEPQNVEALVAKANALQSVGRLDDARATYRAAVLQRPILSRAAGKSPSEFRSLFIFEPLGGNTPIDDLISQAPFESNMLMLLPEAAVDASSLPGDVVVNLISDVDKSAAALEVCEALVEGLAKPIVNHPSKALLTGRADIARALSNISDCHMPVTRDYSVPDLAEAIRQREFQIAHPLIIRAAGTHGGEEMELVDSDAGLDRYLKSTQAAKVYVTDYADYRSGDGYFRKYRIMFVGEQALPYHLAIGSQWKVHHASTDMLNHPWMQEEEAKFLNDPHSVLSPAHYAALHQIQAKVGLEFFGIDCAIDRSDRLVIFEVNASMLVHLRNESFPYKTEAVVRIKTAFWDLLRERATRKAAA